MWRKGTDFKIKNNISKSNNFNKLCGRKISINFGFAFM